MGKKMEKVFTTVLILFSFIFQINAQNSVDDEFQGILKKFGTKYQKMERKLIKQARKNKEVMEMSLFDGRKVIQLSIPHKGFNEMRFYIFSRGRFLDGYQTITTYQKHYSFVRQSLDASCETDEVFKKQRINRVREYNPLCPTTSTYSYRNVRKNYFVTLGGLHMPEDGVDDLFSIAVYRGQKY